MDAIGDETHEIISYCGLFPAPPPVSSYVIKNIVTDFHADGTDNFSDECQFEEAVAYFNALDPQIPKTIVIPSGTYYIGRQDITSKFYLKGHSVMCFENISNLTIMGDNPSSPPILRFQDCMKYGVFDYPDNPEYRLLGDLSAFPVSGTIVSGSNVMNTTTSTSALIAGYRISGPGITRGTEIVSIGTTSLVMSNDAAGTTPLPGSDTFTTYCGGAITSVYDYTQLAYPGMMIHLNGCHNVTIKDIELDGNIDNAQVGGGYSQGIQAAYDGIFINASKDVTIDNVNVHHFGSDGIRIYYQYCPSSYEGQQIPPPSMNMNITNSKFNYNGRNGMTWGGGSGLTVIGSEFNWTGQSRLVSPPGAGIDIEYENSNIGNSNGTFIDCDFKFNKNYGMTCNAFKGFGNRDNYDNFAKNFDFQYCRFVGSEFGLCAIPNSKGFAFRHCDFYGELQFAYPSLANNLAAQNTNHQNPTFISCTFNEEYLDPILGGLNISSTPDEFGIAYTDPGVCHPTCGSGLCSGHPYAINFGQTTRIRFESCSLTTKYSLKEILIGNNCQFPVNSYSLSTFKDCIFENHGLNGMSCDGGYSNPLYVIYNANFLLPVSQFNYPVTNFANYGPPWYCSGCGDIYYGHRAAITNPQNVTGTSISINTSYFPKFIPTPDPNPIGGYFWVPCQAVPITYPVCAPLRKKSTINDIMFIFTVYPNPSSAKLTLVDSHVDDFIVIKNLLGQIVESKLINSLNTEISIQNYKPGIYLINSQKGEFCKFVKIE
ncbi:MAG: T9SS type A sorting domain-containing protein [Bacteroidota bacterium]